jgi:hypothetical protein
VIAMEEPPLMLDGARVIEYAELDRTVAPTGRISVTVGGAPVDMNSVAGVVMAEDLIDGGVFLLHCNDRWETLAAGHYANLAAARQSADEAYSGLTMRWKPFHELSAEEAAEVETTRKFLRQLADEFPNQ